MKVAIRLNGFFKEGKKRVILNFRLKKRIVCIISIGGKVSVNSLNCSVNIHIT